MLGLRTSLATLLQAVRHHPWVAAAVVAQELALVLAALGQAVPQTQNVRRRTRICDKAFKRNDVMGEVDRFLLVLVFK